MMSQAIVDAVVGSNADMAHDAGEAYRLCCKAARDALARITSSLSPTQTGGSGAEGVTPLEALDEIASARWPGDDAVSRIQAFARRTVEAALSATPNPIEPRAGVGREEVAKIVYQAMTWAADQSCTDYHPAWAEGGNSFAQDEARSKADAIIALFAGAGE